MTVLPVPAWIKQWWIASAMGAGPGSSPSTMFLPVASSKVHTIGSGGESFRWSGTGFTPSPCTGRTMKLCWRLAFSGTGRQNTWSGKSQRRVGKPRGAKSVPTSFQAMLNATLPSAPVARMPPSFLSTNSNVYFLLCGMEKLTPRYCRHGLVAVLVKLDEAAPVPFCAPLLSSSLRFFAVGSFVGCDAWFSIYVEMSRKSVVCVGFWSAAIV